MVVDPYADFKEEIANIKKQWEEITKYAKKNGKYSVTSKKYLENQIILFLKKFEIIGNADTEKYEITARFFLNYVRSKENIPAQENVISIIDREVKGYKSLQIVEDAVTKQYDQSLSTLDQEIVRRIYTKLCMEYFIQDLRNVLREIVRKQKNYKKLVDIMNTLHSIDSITRITNPLNVNKYLHLIKTYCVVHKDEEKLFFMRLRSETLTQTFFWNEYVNIEIEFIINLINFIINFKNQDVIGNLRLYDACRGEIEFNTFLDNILNLESNFADKNLDILKEKATFFKSTNYKNMDLFKETMRPYTAQPRFYEKEENGFNFMEVSGKNIILSDVISYLEDTLSKNKEFRFVSADVLHIDTNLTRDKWHGKNIVVSARTIKVYGDIDWNLSGNDNDKIYERAQDAKNVSEEGEKGADGLAGESGGNVLFITENIEYSGKFTIISNGGRGSNGQDGGYGANGEDGKGITRDEIFKQLTPPAYKNNSQALNATTNIINYLYTIKETEFESKNTDDIKYLRIKTKENNEIVFSASEKKSHQRSAYLLFKGSPGKAGSPGGEYGYGGLGGYSGQISINSPNVEIIGETGENGNNGLGGVYGKFGTVGWDAGYIDYSNWLTAKYFGRDNKTKLHLVYSNDESKGVLCNYKNQYVDIEELGSTDLSVPRYQQRRNKQDQEVQSHAKPIKQKAISKTHIETLYKNNCKYIPINETLLQVRRYTSEEIMKTVKEENVFNEELRLKRTIKFNYKPKYITLKDDDSPPDFFRTVEQNKLDIDSMIEKMKNNPKPDWNSIRQINLNLSQLTVLFTILISTIGNEFGEKEIENMLIEKYRLGSLEEIAIQLPNNFATEKFYPRATVKFFKIGEGDYKISHSILGPLYKYFENDLNLNKNIINYTKEVFIKYDRRFKYSFKMFVLYKGQHADANPATKQSLKDYNDFTKTHQIELQTALANFEKELSDPKNAKLHNMWINNKNDVNNIDFRNEIYKNSTLKKLYRQYLILLDKEYDWRKDYLKDDIINAYYTYIRNRNIYHSVLYTELLSYIFEANIRIYSRDKNDNYTLYTNHNPSSINVIHIFPYQYKTYEFIPDEDYIKLDDHIKRAKQYKQILNNVLSFNTKAEFDNYLKGKSFMPNNKAVQSSSHKINENDDLNVIVNSFPADETIEIKTRLNKLLSENINEPLVIHFIAKRFNDTKRIITYQQMLFLLNAIIDSYMKNKKTLNIFNWIVAAYPQEKWIDEVFLLSLENYFKKLLSDKMKWREYLSKIEDKNVLLLLYTKLYNENYYEILPINMILEIVHLLSNIPADKLNVGLLNTELPEWVLVLKQKYWSHKISTLATWQQNSLENISINLMIIGNIAGYEIIKKFIDILETKEIQKEAVYLQITNEFRSGNWNLNEEVLEDLSNTTMTDWLKKMEDIHSTEKNRDFTELIKIIKSNQTTSKNISGLLHSIEKSITSVSEKNDEEINDFSEWAKKIKANINKKGKTVDVYENIIKVIKKALSFKRNIELTDSQHLSILTLLSNKSNTLLHIRTGDGKSIVIVATAIILNLCGEKVDIVTNCAVTAKRDTEVNKDIYEIFNISVSHNCSDEVEERKFAYSNSDIVYGTLTNFQRDYLLDRFYEENVLGDRNFSNIIVDEVDSLLLDVDNNVLYLSQDIPGIDKLEAVFIFIWQWVNQPSISNDGVFKSLHLPTIKYAVIKNIFGLITKDDVRSLDTYMNELIAQKIWNFLIGSKIISQDGRLLSNIINVKALPFELKEYHSSIKFLLSEASERMKNIRIPNYFIPFVMRHLETWIENAKTALFMKEKVDYIVDVEPHKEHVELNPSIIMLNKETGAEQNNCQWDNALHQFLQLKHGCKLSLLCLKNVLISNVTLFNQYKKIHALTSTPCLQEERNIINKLYKLDFATIPMSKNYQLMLKTNFRCKTVDIWLNSIYLEATKVIQEKRSVLLICENMKNIDKICKYFKEKKINITRIYMRDYDELDLSKAKIRLHISQIIIVTGLAARFIDITLTEELKNNGGFHVLLTYVTKNRRIEQMFIERAAASGRGTGQVVFVKDSKSNFAYRFRRDIEEFRVLRKNKYIYDIQIYAETYSMNVFSNLIKKYKKTIAKLKISPKLLKTILNNFIEIWTFWLDENGRKFEKIKKREIVDKVNLLMKDLTSQIDKVGIQNWSYMIMNPYRKVAVAKHYTNENGYYVATILFNNIITEEPHFSECAHYYKAYMNIKSINWNNDPLNDKDQKLLSEAKFELNEAARLFEDHSVFLLYAGNVVDIIKQHNKVGVIEINSYRTQKKNLSDMYIILIKSINNILGHPVSTKSFIDLNFDRNRSKELFDVLLMDGILKKPKLKNNINVTGLRDTAYDYGVSTKELTQFLSQFKDEDVNSHLFEEKMKESINLPDKELFWELLVEKSILEDDIIVLAIDEMKLESIYPEKLKLFKEMIDTNVWEKKDITIHSPFELVLFPEMPNNSDMIIEKYQVKNALSTAEYEYLEKEDVFMYNRKATINLDNLESSINLGKFDSISLKDFDKIDITEDLAVKILSELNDKRIIKEGRNDSYKLLIEMREINNIKLDAYRFYDAQVKALLVNCFAYTIALEEMRDQMAENRYPYISLTANLYRNLHLELMSKKIVEPAIVISVSETTGATSADDEIISRKIKRVKYSLNAEDISKLHLSSITNYLDPDYTVNEARLFVMNGLEDVIMLDKASNMFGIVSGLLSGSMQVIMGMLVSRYLEKKFLGESLMGGNIHNILYAINVWKHKEFYWDDYFSRSIMDKLINAVVLTTNLFNINKRVFGGRSMMSMADNSNLQERKVDEMENIEYQLFKTKILESSIWDETQELKNIIIYSDSEILIENYIESFATNIVTKYTCIINRSIDAYVKTSSTVEQAFFLLGEEGGKQLIETFSDRYLFTNSQLNQFEFMAYQTTKQNLSTFELTLQKLDNPNFMPPTEVLTNVLQWTSNNYHVEFAMNMMSDFLRIMDKEVVKELNVIKKRSPYTESLADYKEAFNIFKDYINQYWKLAAKIKLMEILQRTIHLPIVTRGGIILIKYFENKIQSEYYRKDLSIFDKFKRNYRKKEIEEQKKFEASKTINYFTDNYSEHLIKLLPIIKKPNILVEIINNNIPVDVSYTKLCVFLIKEILVLMNYAKTDVSFFIYGENIVKKIHETEKQGNNTVFIELELKEERFYLYKGQKILKDSDTKNKTLYDILPSDVKVNLKEEEFVTKLIFIVEKNNEQAKKLINKSFT